KDAVPNDAQDFSFTATGTGFSNFILDDDGDNSNGLSNTQVFTITGFSPPQFDSLTATIVEGALAGWDLTNLVLTESGTADSTVNLGTGTANLTIQEGENITITYTNTKRGRIIVDKVTNPSGDPQVFSFTSSYGGGSFTL